MINHIVMWKLQPFDTALEKQQAAQLVKQEIESLRGKIPQLLDLHVGINIDNPHANFDIVLYSQFHTMEDVASYQIHPEHLAMGSKIKHLLVDRTCVDYSL